MKTLVLTLLALCGTAAFAAPSYNVTSGGITYTDLPTYTQVKIADDDLSAAIAPAGFSFWYFGGTFTEFKIGSNGYILMGNAGTATNTIPDHASSGLAISPMWCDLITSATATWREIGYNWSGGVLTVEWYNVEQRFTGMTLKHYYVRMQALLDTNTGNIEFRYGSVSGQNPVGATTTEGDAVAISAQPGIVAHEVIDGVDAGNINPNGSVKVYPLNRYVRFAPVAPIITTAQPLPNGTAGQPYSVQFTAIGGTPGYTWSATGLPAGWTMSASGLLSAPGSSVAVPSFGFDVTVQDSLGDKDTRNFTIQITTPPVSITTTSPLPPGTAGQGYSVQFAATGGIAPYDWSSVNLPSGWSIDIHGLLTAPAGSVVAGSFNFNIKVQDTDTPPDTQTLPFSVTIVPAGSPLTITTSSPLPVGTAGTAYAQQFNATGGASPYTWGATGLPAGWSISTGGLLSAASGSVTAGTFNFTVNVVDGASGSDSDPFSVTINAPPPLTITTTTLAGGIVGNPYGASIIAINGSGSFSWTLVSGSLPPGVTGIPGSGNPAIGLSGLPTSAGTYNFTVQVQDGMSNTDTQAYIVTISVAGSGLSGGSGGGGGCNTGENASILMLLAGVMAAFAWRRRRLA